MQFCSLGSEIGLLKGARFSLWRAERESNNYHSNEGKTKEMDKLLQFSSAALSDCLQELRVLTLSLSNPVCYVQSVWLCVCACLCVYNYVHKHKCMME